MSMKLSLGRLEKQMQTKQENGSSSEQDKKYLMLQVGFLLVSSHLEIVLTVLKNFLQI